MFASCAFNPMCDGKMLSEYPRLSEIIDPDWTEEANLDGLIRYCIMVYDPRSPLVLNERDLNHRKGVAAELAGMDMTDEEWLTSIYVHSHPFIVDLIVKYLIRYCKSKEYALICATEYKYWESIRRLMTPIADGKDRDALNAVQIKAAISEELDKDIARLDNYISKFFGEDTELIRKSKGKLSPELISTR